MEQLTIVLVRKLTELNGFAEEIIRISYEDQDILAMAESIFDGKRFCNIKKKAFCPDGKLILFVETINSLPIDDSFIEDYFTCWQ